MSKRTNDFTFYVYDMKDNERLAHICDSLDELALFFGRPKDSIKSSLTRKQMFERRFLVVREINEDAIN